jgi:hypothetical protein
VVTVTTGLVYLYGNYEPVKAMGFMAVNLSLEGA